MLQRKAASIRRLPTTLSSKHLSDPTTISSNSIRIKQPTKQHSSLANLSFQSTTQKRSVKVPTLGISVACKQQNSLSPKRAQSRLMSEDLLKAYARTKSLSKASKPSADSAGCFSLLKQEVKSDAKLCSMMHELTDKPIKGTLLTQKLEEFRGAVLVSLQTSSHLQKSLSYVQSVGKYSLKTLVRAQNSMLMELHCNLESLDKEEALSTKSSPDHDKRTERELACLTTLRAELKQNLERLKYCEKILKESTELKARRPRSNIKLRSQSPEKLPYKLKPVKITRQLPSVSFDSSVVPKLVLPKGNSASFQQEFLQKAPEFSESWRQLIGQMRC